MAYQNVTPVADVLRDNPDAMGDRAVSAYGTNALVTIQNQGNYSVLVARGSLAGGVYSVDTPEEAVLIQPGGMLAIREATANKFIMVWSVYDDVKIIHELDADLRSIRV